MVFWSFDNYSKKSGTFFGKVGQEVGTVKFGRGILTLFDLDGFNSKFRGNDFSALLVQPAVVDRSRT